MQCQSDLVLLVLHALSVAGYLLTGLHYVGFGAEDVWWLQVPTDAAGKPEEQLIIGRAGDFLTHTSTRT